MTSNPKEYTVGWICAKQTEYVASRAFLDERYDDAPESLAPSDTNIYTLGKVGKHNVVIAVLPDGEYGIASATRVAADMLNSFPNIRFGLMVGTGGGAPSKRRDIRLGDVVVSAPRDGNGGVFQYDFGKHVQNQEFKTTGFVNQPPALLRTAVAHLAAQYEAEGHQLGAAIDTALERFPRLRKRYGRPDPETDRLYQPGVIHPDDQAFCPTVCGEDHSKLVPRQPRVEDEDNLAIHYGLIASANRVMKDATVRDQFAARHDILCFDMEAAGLMNFFPCLIIRGICNYSDTHKNDEWLAYAAMAAAAYAKDLLRRIPPRKPEAERKSLASSVHETVLKTDSRPNRSGDTELLGYSDGLRYGDVIKGRRSEAGQWLLDSSTALEPRVDSVEVYYKGQAIQHLRLGGK